MLQTRFLIVGVLFVAACSPQPETDTKSSTAPATAASSAPHLPDVALDPDGKRPLTCADWVSISEERQHALAAYVLAKMDEIPDDIKVDRVRKGVKADCAESPDETLYNVAMRRAMHQEPAANG